MRYITLMLLLIFLVLGTVAYRALQVAGYPMGLGSFGHSGNFMGDFQRIKYP